MAPELVIQNQALVIIGVADLLMMAVAEDDIGATVSGHSGRSKAEQRMELFHARLRDRGLKSTSPRDDIARVFFQLGRHVSAEELYGEVKKINPHVGYATIYRTLKLLKDCELLTERHFDEDQARFEVAGEHHHDHFICEHCGKIVEFEDDAIERMQQDVAKKLGVVMTRHKLELYGLCHDCRRLR
jgi:Fur family ferric uptake transcriptional regulator